MDGNTPKLPVNPDRRSMATRAAEALEGAPVIGPIAKTIEGGAAIVAGMAASVEQTLEKTPVVGPVVRFMRKVDAAEIGLAGKIIGKEVESANKVKKAILPKP
jgi:hypothetical protein